MRCVSLCLSACVCVGASGSVWQPGDNQTKQDFYEHRGKLTACVIAMICMPQAHPSPPPPYLCHSPYTPCLASLANFIASRAQLCIWIWIWPLVSSPSSSSSSTRFIFTAKTEQQQCGKQAEYMQHATCKCISRQTFSWVSNLIRLLLCDFDFHMLRQCTLWLHLKFGWKTARHNKCNQLGIAISRVHEIYKR